MQSRKNRIANEPEAIKASARCILYVSLDQSYTPSDFLIPKMRRRIPLKSLGLRKDTTFILSPPKQKFLHRATPNITSRAAKTARQKLRREKSGNQKPHTKRNQNHPSAASPISHRQHRPCARWREERPLAKHLFSKMLTFSICRDGKSVREKNKSS